MAYKLIIIHVCYADYVTARRRCDNVSCNNNMEFRYLSAIIVVFNYI